MYWCFRNNCLFPNISRTFRTQYYWSYFAGQCDNSEQLLPVHLPCWMCVQFAFYHQFWINTWRSKIEQETDSVLPACWSYGQKSQGSWCDWLECAASCTISAQSMEETSKHGVLGPYQTCSKERVDILSDSIECNHSSRNTSSLLYSESCQDGNWRSLTRKSIHVTSASTKDLFETRMDKRIGFRTRSTIRSWAAIQKYPIETTNSKSNSWENGETLYHAWRYNCARWKEQRPVIRRSMSILFAKNLVLQSERRDPLRRDPLLNSSVIQARSPEDRKDFNVEQAHERTRRFVSVTNTENVPGSS